MKKRPNAQTVRPAKRPNRAPITVNGRPWKDYAEFRRTVIEPLQAQARELEKTRLQGRKPGSKVGKYHPPRNGKAYHQKAKWRRK